MLGGLLLGRVGARCLCGRGGGGGLLSEALQLHPQVVDLVVLGLGLSLELFDLGLQKALVRALRIAPSPGCAARVPGYGGEAGRAGTGNNLLGSGVLEMLSQRDAVPGDTGGELFGCRDAGLLVPRGTLTRE